MGSSDLFYIPHLDFWSLFPPSINEQSGGINVPIILVFCWLAHSICPPQMENTTTIEKPFPILSEQVSLFKAGLHISTVCFATVASHKCHRLLLTAAALIKVHNAGAARSSRTDKSAQILILWEGHVGKTLW